VIFFIFKGGNMKKLITGVALLMLLMAFTLSGCGSAADENVAGNQQQGDKVGTLHFKANGEGFVRQGFISKDGWTISFDNVYVNIANVVAYQSDPPYDSHMGGEVSSQSQISLAGIQTVDLAEGDENAGTILVAEMKDVQVGHYNAISWQMLKAAEGPAEGYSLVIVGQAEKEGRAIDFIIKDEQEYRYTGGEYVGDERKGIIQEGGIAEIEMTFHFDHIFGDAETPLEDELNAGAPGFEPFASLAMDGRLEVDMAALKSGLSQSDYQKLQEMLPTLGHVGEGHCHVEKL